MFSNVVINEKHAAFAWLSAYILWLQTHRRTPWTGNNSPLLFAALDKADLLILTTAPLTLTSDVNDQWCQNTITVIYTVLGPMVRHYALGYGFHTVPNLLIKPLREAHGFVLYTNDWTLTSRGISQRYLGQSSGICIQNKAMCLS